MAYITPIHRPCGIRLAIKLNLVDPEDECLVVAKYNRLEIYQIDAEAENTALVLEIVASQVVYGRITILQKYRPANSLVDQLFVGTDQACFFTARWDASSGRLITGSSFIDLADKTARVAQTGERCHIDPSEEYMLLEVYEGILTTIPLNSRVGRQVNRGVMGSPMPYRISEFHVKSSAFIQRPRKIPRVALLWEDYEGNSRLKFRDLDTSNAENAEWEDVADDERDRENIQLDLGASHLIPVQQAPYGLIVLAETSILYFDDSDQENDVSEVLSEATIWMSWARIDNQRYVLADEYGKLYLLMLQLNESNVVTEITIEEQGSTRQAACMQYLDNGLVFIGSHQGDSQVIRLRQKSPEVTQIMPSLAPVLDFTVMDMGNRSGAGPGNEYSTGQARIVTGSGSWSDGSIRSVRSGVGVEVLALLPDFEHVSNLFAIRAEGSSEPNALLISYADETRMLAFSPTREVQELENYKSVTFSDQTLLATNTSDGRLLQVTRSEVKLLDLNSEANSSTWRVDKNQQITSVSTTDQILAICVSGQAIVLLDIRKQLTVAKNLGPYTKQISCVAVSSLLPQALFIGYWSISDDNRLDIINLSDGQLLKSIDIDEDEPVVPRSILLSNTINDPKRDPTVFVAMADGNVVSFELDRQTFKPRQLKRTILGTREAQLKELSQGTRSSVFVASEHPSLIYDEGGRMTFSAVDAEQITSVCDFNSKAFPGAVVLATTAGDLRIGRIDYERTTHVQPLQMGATARRLAYSGELKAFGIGTIERKVEDGAEVCYSSFQLVDEVVFKPLDTYKFDRDILVEAVIRAELDDGYGNRVERFIVGTGIVENAEEEFHGQILVFEVTEERKLRVIAKERTKGTCRTLGVVGNGRIVAGLNKTIAVYAYEFSSTGTPSLRKVATKQVSTMPIAMCVTGTEVAIADLMKSISILLYKPKDASAIGNESLTEIARHYQTFWSTSVAKVGTHSWLGSDAEGNLIVLSQNLDGPTVDDQRRLVVDSEFNLGELVNQMRSIEVEASPSAPVIPKAFLATREGSIYLFGFIADDKRDLLINLQERLAERVNALGDIPFMKYRAMRNEVVQEEEPRRFVDGELVERFLDCEPDVQAECVNGLMIAGRPVTIDEVKDVVDNLRRMH